MESMYFLPLFALVAFLYASVGHGGASGYLALMALTHFAPQTMKSSALILNLFVSAIAFYHFYRGGFFRKSLFIPFATTSVPAAFLGAMIPVGDLWYKRILGICLLLAAVRITGFFMKFHDDEKIKEPPTWAGMLSGAVLGLISGMTGIGGGVLLGPLILLMNWGKVKETAAASALFIFVNSAAGLAGLMVSKPIEMGQSISIMMAFSIAGGFAGSRWGAGMAPGVRLRQVLALVLVIAALKLAFI
jgi:uncharacterized membrane protein YfcA